MGLIVTAVIGVLGLGAVTDRIDFALYSVMLTIFGAGVVIAAAWAIRLHAWIQATDAEFRFLEQNPSVQGFLTATSSSTTPSRGAIFGLYHSVRPGRRTEIDSHIAVMSIELVKAPAVIRLIGSTLVLMGILGTALGAMLSLTELSEFASTADVSAGPELFGQLLGPGSPIASLSLAFGSTVLGLASKIVLGAIAGSLQAHGQAYVSHVAELLANFVAPDLWINGETGEGVSP